VTDQSARSARRFRASLLLQSVREIRPHLDSLACTSFLLGRQIAQGRVPGTMRFDVARALFVGAVGRWALALYRSQVSGLPPAVLSRRAADYRDRGQVGTGLCREAFLKLTDHLAWAIGLEPLSEKQAQDHQDRALELCRDYWLISEEGVAWRESR
jgi:hypothetical protein